jgi:hypothetical protein
MWRILVHRDPFLLFDIPLDPELQLERKGTILALSNIAGLIPCFIEEDVGFLDAKEILLLVRIFAHTVSVDPKTRSLDRVLELLEQHSGRPKDEYVPIGKHDRKVWQGLRSPVHRPHQTRNHPH